MPKKNGTYYLNAELGSTDGQKIASSRKIVHVIPPPGKPDPSVMQKVGIFGSGTELLEYLGADRELKDFAKAKEIPLIIITEGQIHNPSFRSQLAVVKTFLENDGRIIIIEPEYGVTGEETANITPDVSLRIQRRADIDKGGYDSYIFVTDHRHRLWDGIQPGHLKMFNGGFGGEIVSQHDVIPSCEHNVLAQCGLQLQVPAVFEIPIGMGKIIVSRLQLRGRLIANRGGNGLYDRRVDPVLQKYLYNLITYALH
jgi:hypothetical protein